MTPTERDLALQATSQMQLGNGMFEIDRRFKADFCKQHGITEAYLTQLVRALLNGE